MPFEVRTNSSFALREFARLESSFHFENMRGLTLVVVSKIDLENFFFLSTRDFQK